MSHPRGARPRLFVSLFGLFILALIVFPQTAKKPQRIVNTDPQQRLAWFDEFAKMKTASKFKDLKWQFLGPNNVSGRVTDVAVVAPKGRNYTIFAATASGGVWKTDNEGVTWAPVFENAVSTAIGDIALDPSDPQTVWIGTGECNIFRSSQAGAGVYKSTDGGETWKNVVDNVPGVPLIGPKFARQLLEQYHTLESVLDHAGDVARVQRAPVAAPGHG